MLHLLLLVLIMGFVCTHVLQVSQRLLEDHVVLASALYGAVLGRLNLPQMSKSKHLLLADVGATHDFGLAADSDDRHVLLQL